MAYSKEDKEKILNEIFDKIENGVSTRKSIIDCKMHAKTFYEWIDNDEEKSKQYARACELRADALLDEMINIVDDISNDWEDIIVEGDNGDMIVQDKKVNYENIQRSRLRYDARKWLVSKLHPKKYGEKLDVTSKGDAINTPSVVNVQIIKSED